MAEEINIGGYTVRAASKTDALALSALSTSQLQKLDKNGDKVISEDELVEYAGDDSDDSYKTGNSEVDALLATYGSQLNDFFKYQMELLDLETQKGKLEAKIKETDDKNKLASYKAQLSVLESRISGARQNIQTTNSQITQTNTNIVTTMARQRAAQSQAPVTAYGANNSFVNTGAVYTGEKIPANLANRLDAKLGAGFSAKCESVAASLNCNANDLLAMMYSESGINPHVQGYNGATGLIQFMPSVLSSNGYSTSQVANMSGVQQLDVVLDILSKGKAMCGYSSSDRLDTGSLYAICFLPAVAKREVLCTTSDSLSWAYRANKGLDLNGDGQITKTDLANRLHNKYNELCQYF